MKRSKPAPVPQGMVRVTRVYSSETQRYTYVRHANQCVPQKMYDQDAIIPVGFMVEQDRAARELRDAEKEVAQAVVRAQP